MHAGEKLEHGGEVAAERKPGLQWRKAKSMLNLVQNGTGKVDTSEYGKPPMQHHSTSLRDFRGKVDTPEHGKPPSQHHSTSLRDIQSLRDVCARHEVRYRRPSSGSIHSSLSEPATRYRRPSTGSIHSSSSEPANRMEYDGSRGAPTPDGQSRAQTAKPVSLKALIKEQFKIQALEWQPSNYIAPISGKDAIMIKQMEKAETRKVFRARK